MALTTFVRGNNVSWWSRGRLMAAVVAAASVLGAAVMFADGPQPSQPGSVLPYKNPKLTVAQRVDDLLARMTLDEKVGQMTQADNAAMKSSTTSGKYFLGSVLSGGGSEIPDISRAGWAAYHGRPPETGTWPRGWGSRCSTASTPCTVTTTSSAPWSSRTTSAWVHAQPELVEETARITAKEMAGDGHALGVRARAWRCPATSAGAAPTKASANLRQLVAELGARGRSRLPGRRTCPTPHSVLACAKHFLGDGGTGTGAARAGSWTRATPQMDEATLRAIHLPGYIAAIKAGVGNVMVSYSSWNGAKCTATSIC